MKENRILEKGDIIVARLPDGIRTTAHVVTMFADGKEVKELPWDRVGGTHVIVLLDNNTWTYGDDVWEYK